ncbi:MAG TPA: metalloregulator ArsR/SmtB family transcription factor [Thermomicrobiales bacterium]|nr:metalloregulator ArsR/SmtB family transcription factor [Thermomicrobiales bacterium]
MGELVVGRPALQVKSAMSVALDLVSVMSLLYRAVPGSGLDAWLVQTRRNLSYQLQEDLDLLHGFSGRLLYYMEEPIMRFEPLREDRLNASVDDLLWFLGELDADEYRDMAIRAVDRVHQDLGTGLVAPGIDEESAWYRYVEPGLTTADAADVVAMILQPDLLKERTIRLIRGIWDSAYGEEHENRRAELEEAERIARAESGRGFGIAFAELTGNRLPSTLAAGLNQVASVTFCPSAHVGAFVSYIVYPPVLVVFFSAQNVLAMGRSEELEPDSGTIVRTDPATGATTELLAGDDLLEMLRALGDANRLRIIDLLGTGQLYAQEIVGRLGIAQSAVSRHLSQLERAGLIRVEPRRGMKYYAIDHHRMDVLAETLRSRGH